MNSSLSLSKSGVWQDSNGNGIAEAGETINYTFVVMNTGDTDITGINIDDPTLGITITPNNFNLAVGETQMCTGTYDIQQFDIDTGEVLNTATAEGEDADGQPVEGTGSTTVLLPRPSISLTKTGMLLGNPKPGEMIEYEFLITNTGNTTLTNVMLIDPKISPSCFIVDLAPGDSELCVELYTITEQDVLSCMVMNIATVTATSASQGNPQVMDTAQFAINFPQTDLVITKIVDDTNKGIGQDVIFNLTATNNGPNNATGVIVTDMVPGSFVITEVQTPPGTNFDFNTNIWTIGNLANGESKILEICGYFTEAGMFINTATIEGNECDPFPDNNSTSVDVEVFNVNLTIDPAEATNPINTEHEITLTVKSDPNDIPVEGVFVKVSTNFGIFQDPLGGFTDQNGEAKFVLKSSQVGNSHITGTIPETNISTNAIKHWVICVFPGAMVETPNGFKKIEDIRKGDFVIDEFGNSIEVLNNVECLPGYQGYTIFKKNCFGNNMPNEDIKITNDHPIKPPGYSEGIAVQKLANKKDILKKLGFVPNTYMLITKDGVFVRINNLLVSSYAEEPFIKRFITNEKSKLVCKLL